MESTLLTAGLACLIAAVIGGGLKAFGVEIPVLTTWQRQLALFVLGLVLCLVAFRLTPGRQNDSGAAPTVTTAPPPPAQPQAAPTPPPVVTPSAPTRKVAGCSISGRVFEEGTGRPLPGLIIGFDTYTDDKRSERLVFNAGMTGIDGAFRVDCRDVDRSKFPLRLMVSEINPRRVTHHMPVRIDYEDERTEINLPLTLYKP
jgi:hypothetical protein